MEGGQKPFGYAPAGLGEYGYVPPMRNITYAFLTAMEGGQKHFGYTPSGVQAPLRG